MRRRLMLLPVLAAAVAIVAPAAHAASPNVVISQVYGGGGNSGATYTHDFVELFNRSSAIVSLDGWSLQYTSATGTGNFGATTTQITPLSGSIPAGGYVLVREASTAAVGSELPPPFLTDDSPIAMAAGAGKVALTNTTDPLGCNGGSTPCDAAALAKIVDLVGYGNANFFEGTAAAGTLSNTTSASRKDGGCTETDDNAADFTVGTPDPRGFLTDPHTCGVVADQPVAVTCGTTLTAVQGVGASRAVSATDPDDTVVSLSVASVTPTPAAGSISLASVVPAQADGGTATATLQVSAAVPAGSYAVQLSAANDDDPAQTGGCSLTVSVTGVKTIGEVQGATLDTEVGSLDRSPFAPPTGNGNGDTVVVRGVITQKTESKTSAGIANFGFFLQSTAASSDGDPLTSDGVFVFMGRFTDLIGGYVPQVGDEVVISARVSEFFFYTELVSASLVAKLGSFADLDAVTPAFSTTPPDDFAASERYWERHEGMRARVPAGSVTVDGNDVFSPSDGELWVIRGDHPVAQRSDPFARRVFRDAHPLDDQPGLFDNGNGYRILLGSQGIKLLEDDVDALIAPARTFTTTTGDLVGGVSFGFSKYRVEVGSQPSYEAGVDPSTNAPPAPADRDVEYSISDYNVENLYDFRNDPFDGCDFATDTGCPGVRPPFDYVPASDAVYQARLGEFAQQIVEDLHAPDILLVQEAEDQDICTVTGGAFTCDFSTNDADGKPDTLQELAVRIHDTYGIAYDAAYDRDGSDDRGIVAAFLYRSDRVQLLPATDGHPVLGSSPTVDYPDQTDYNADVQNPKALNADLPPFIDPATADGTQVYTRDPQVGYFRVWRTAVGVGAWTDVYAISEHFSSTPNARVDQRREQARFSARIVEALADAPDGTRVAVGGDLNVYPRPDDPFAPPNVSDQLGPLYDEAGMHNLFDTIVDEVPAAAYSYVFQGQTQTLDGQFVTGTLLDELVQARNTHVNADFPADTPGDGARGLSDHDPLVARYELRTTLAGLVELVLYYGDTGAITGNNTLRQLLSQLGKDHLEEFIGQVRDKTPRFVTPTAAAAMIHEAELLLE